MIFSYFYFLLSMIIVNCAVKANSNVLNVHENKLNEENFYYCVTKDIKQIVNLSPNCSNNQVNPTKPPNANNWEKSFLRNYTNNILGLWNNPTSISVISKNKYFINTIGFECHKTIRTTWFNESFWFKTTTSQYSEIVLLSRIDCLLMVDQKLCGLNHMKCDDSNNCYYKSNPEDSYYWNNEHKVETIDCSFNRKHIIAEFDTSPLFFAPLNECKATDLYCKLRNSVIAWNSMPNNTCLYSKVHSGAGYQTLWQSEDIFYSKTDRLAFQIKSIEQVCGIRVLKTSTDVLLVVHSDPLAANHVKLEVTKPSNTFNHQHDLNSLILAEFDDKQLLQFNAQNAKDNLDRFYKCRQLADSLAVISNQNDKFNFFHDINGQQIITYSLNGVVYLPYCTQTRRLKIKADTTSDEGNYCDAHLPIMHTPLASDMLTYLPAKEGFLTQNNFVRDFSAKLKCPLINSFQILPSTSLMLTRKGRKCTIDPLEHLQLVDVTQFRSTPDKLNFNHLNEIISNYQQNEMLYEFERINTDPIGPMVNYQHINDEQYHSNMLDKYDTIKKQIREKFDFVQGVGWMVIAFVAMFLLAVCLKFIICCYRLTRACSETFTIKSDHLAVSNSQVGLDKTAAVTARSAPATTSSLKTTTSK